MIKKAGESVENAYYIVTKYFALPTCTRAANNGQSMDNVRSELGIDWTNPWIVRHFLQSFTDSFREIILIFNYHKSYDC